MLRAQLFHLAVLDELVGPADANYGDVEVHFFKGFCDCRAEAAHFDVVLKGHEGGYAGGVSGQHLAVDGLDEARIDERGGVAFALKPCG